MQKPCFAFALLWSLILLFSASCGHLANPAPPKAELTSDKDLQSSCEDMTAEILDLQAQQTSVQKQIDSQRTQNILSGIGGYLVIVPYAFIDPTTQKNDSKYSYEQREEHLRMLSTERGCIRTPLPLDGSVAAAEQRQKPTTAATWRSRVLSVIDGDTIFVADGGKRAKVSLYGVDAPEPGQKFQEEAKKFFKTLEGGRYPVCARRDADDDLCIVYYGFPVNAEMLKAGLVWYVKGRRGCRVGRISR